MKKGKLTLIWGSMFSGKTEELLRIVNRSIYAQKKTMLFKPKKDNRYNIGEIVSHNSKSMDAIDIVESREILKKAKDLDLVGIDEVQFFDKEILNVIETLLQNGVDVICSGLDMDYKGEPFDITMRLATCAEKCIKLHAVCMDCGNDAWISHRISKEGEKVVIGGSDKYIALCRNCYMKRTNSNIIGDTVHLIK